MSEMMSNIKSETQTFPTILHQSLKSHTVEEKHNYLMTSYCYAKQHQAWLKEKVTLPPTPCWRSLFQEEDERATSAVWKWFRYKRSDVRQTTVMCQKCKKTLAGGLSSYCEF